MVITKPNVLIVDDDEIIQETLSLIINHLGFNIYGTASDGDEAINFFKENKENIDIILLDINMPNISGIEVLEELNDDIKNTCVIMLTTIKDADYVIRCIRYGASYYIKKNNSPEVIAKLILDTWENYINQKSGEFLQS